MKTREKLKTSYLALFLAFLFLFSVIPAIPTAFAKNDENTLTERIKAIQTDKQRLEIELENVRNEQDSKMKELETVKKQIATIDKEYAYQSALAEIYANSVSEYRQKLIDTQAVESAQYAQLKTVLREMEEAPNISFWGIILNASSISDAIARVELYTGIIDYEKSMLEGLADKREKLGEIKYQLQEKEQKYSESEKELRKEMEEFKQKNEYLLARIDELAIKEADLFEQLSDISPAEELANENIRVVDRELSSQEIDEILTSALTEMQYAHISEDEMELRLTMLKEGLGLVGRVEYFWGGRSFKPGWNDQWGTIKTVQHAGSTTYPYGSKHEYGLDCSGFAFWCALSAYGLESWNSPVEWMADKGARLEYQGANKVIWENKVPGDFVVNSPITHIGVYVCTNSEGKELFVHSCGSRGVCLSTNDYFNFCDACSIFD